MDTQLSELTQRVAVIEAKTYAQNAVLDEIRDDVKSLLASRAFSQGMMKTAVWVSSVIATVVSIVVTWLKAAH